MDHSSTGKGDDGDDVAFTMTPRRTVSADHDVPPNSLSSPTSCAQPLSPGVGRPSKSTVPTSSDEVARRSDGEICGGQPVDSSLISTSSGRCGESFFPPNGGAGESSKPAPKERDDDSEEAKQSNIEHFSRPRNSHNWTSDAYLADEDGFVVSTESTSLLSPDITSSPGAAAESSRGGGAGRDRYRHATSASTSTSAGLEAQSMLTSKRRRSSHRRNDGRNDVLSYESIGTGGPPARPPASRGGGKSRHSRTVSFDVSAVMKQADDDEGAGGVGEDTTGGDATHRRSWSGGLTMVEKFFERIAPSAVHPPRSGGGGGGHHRGGSFSSLEDETRDYHERGQAFLREQARARQKQARLQMQPHPLSTPCSQNYQRTMLSTLPPFPPNSRGPRKPCLASIGDDDWGEEANNEERRVVESVAQSSLGVKEEEREKADDGGSVNSLQVNDSYISSSPQSDGSSLRRCHEDEIPSSAAAQILTAPGLGTQEVGVDDEQAPLLDRQEAHSPSPQHSTQHLETKRDRRKRRKEKRRHEIEQILNEELDKQKAKRKKRHRRKERELMYQQELERERARLIEEWKAEFRAEEEERRLTNRAKRYIKSRWEAMSEKMYYFLTATEAFLSNLPLTIGAIGLSWVTMGVVWFKFAEENLDSCTPVHFNSPECKFPEFPGCFVCTDKSDPFYRLALDFHYICDIVAGTCAVGFFAKLALAWRVVIDDLTNPTTSRPLGLVCITVICVAAGQGDVGEAIVLLTSCVYVCLVFWFFYMAWTYRILPDPSWSPNCVGVGYAAIKTWLYHPFPAKIILVICLSSFVFTYPISMIRVTLNKKISAPVCWIQMSAPSITLYALTIMAQPSRKEETTLEQNPADMTQFQKLHRMAYLPCMHVMFALAVLGACSSVQSLSARFETIRKRPFSPAHAAFCCPILSHANSVQSYRGAIDSFSTIPFGSPFKIILYTYWLFVLVVGTVVTFVISFRYACSLPKWTQVDVTGEEEPPPPNQTMIHDFMDTGDTMRQPFVSPAVLEANEAGTLVRVRRGTEDWRGPYVRTRQVTSLGFEPTMNWSELNQERDTLLDWVAHNQPRTRKRTMSFPHEGEQSRSGMFDDIEAGATRHAGRTHRRSQTDDLAPWAMGRFS